MMNNWGVNHGAISYGNIGAIYGVGGTAAARSLRYFISAHRDPSAQTLERRLPGLTSYGRHTVEIFAVYQLERVPKLVKLIDILNGESGRTHGLLNRR